MHLFSHENWDPVTQPLALQIFSHVGHGRFPSRNIHECVALPRLVVSGDDLLERAT